MTSIFLSVTLFMAASLFSGVAAAAPSVFCEEARPEGWTHCSDAGYPLSEHRSPIEGSFRTGLQSCNSAMTRCTYPASIAEGSATVTPPPSSCQTNH